MRVALTRAALAMIACVLFCASRASLVAAGGGDVAAAGAREPEPPLATLRASKRAVSTAVAEA